MFVRKREYHFEDSRLDKLLISLFSLYRQKREPLSCGSLQSQPIMDVYLPNFETLSTVTTKARNHSSPGSHNDWPMENCMVEHWLIFMVFLTTVVSDIKAFFSCFREEESMFRKWETVMNLLRRLYS